MSKYGPKYKPEFAEQAYKYCLLGATNDDLARMFGVAPSALDKWIRNKPEFAEKVKAGRQVADGRVAESLFRRAIGYSHPEEKVVNVGGELKKVETTKHYPPDTIACIFWLKNRQREKWRDKVDHSVGGENGGPVKIDVAIELVEGDGKAGG